jgi:hypothetical protein
MEKKVIKQIENIAQKKDEEEEARYYEKYNSIFEETYKILEKKDVLLYGGIAINELLPSKLKFYKTTALPDIDVLTINGEKLAKNIVKYFQKIGFNNITTSHSEALHPGTYKVYVDSLQILDITDIPINVFKRLSKNAVKSEHKGIKIVDPQFLRMTLHLILAKGDATTVHRWGKVLERLSLFYKQFPPKVCNNIYKDKRQNTTVTIKEDIVLEDIYKTIYNSISNKEYILFGLHEMDILLDKHIKSTVIQSPIQLLVKDQNLKDIANSIIHNISAHNNTYAKYLHLSKLYNEDTLISDHIFVFYKKIPIISIFHANVCYGYNLYNGIRIASIHTIIFMYLCMILSPYNHFKNLDSLECLVNTLAVLNNKSRGSNKKLLQDVVSQCYGENIGLVTMRKNRLLRLASPIK